jgi:hypothetical protein
MGPWDTSTSGWLYILPGYENLVYNNFQIHDVLKAFISLASVQLFSMFVCFPFNRVDLAII